MHVKGIIKGAVFSLALSFVFILILSLVSYFTQVSDSVITICVYVCVIVSVFTGAMMVSKSCEGKKLINALCVSIIYLAVLIGVSCFINKSFNFDTHFMAMGGGILISGVLGAVIGK